MAGSPWLGNYIVQHLAVLVNESATGWSARWRWASEELEDRGGDVNETARFLGHPERPDTRAGSNERCARLDDAERPVLPQVTSLVTPVVGRGMQDDEVRRGSMIEELSQVVERVRVGVVAPIWVRDRSLRFKSAEVGGVLPLDRTTPGERLDLVYPTRTPPVRRALREPAETQVTFCGGHLVGASCGRPRDEVDDRFELCTEQDRERSLSHIVSGLRKRKVGHQGRTS
jgi:hypothetical protein